MKISWQWYKLNPVNPRHPAKEAKANMDNMGQVQLALCEALPDSTGRPPTGRGLWLGPSLGWQGWQGCGPKAMTKLLEESLTIHCHCHFPQATKKYIKKTINIWSEASPSHKRKLNNFSLVPIASVLLVASDLEVLVWYGTTGTLLGKNCQTDK